MYLIDSANFEEIRRLASVFSFDGVTTNPSLVAQEEKAYFRHLGKLAELIAPKTLYVQLNAPTLTDMKRELEALRKNLPKNLSIKVPATKAGYRLMQHASREVHVTATAVSTYHQAMMSVQSGAKSVVVYIQRLIKAGRAPLDVVDAIRRTLDREYPDITLIGASFDSPGLIEGTLSAGAHKVTVRPKLLDAIFTNSVTEEAVKRFARDFKKVYGKPHAADLGDE